MWSKIDISRGWTSNSRQSHGTISSKQKLINIQVFTKYNFNLSRNFRVRRKKTVNKSTWPTITNRWKKRQIRNFWKCYELSPGSIISQMGNWASQFYDQPFKTHTSYTSSNMHCSLLLAPCQTFGSFIIFPSINYIATIHMRSSSTWAYAISCKVLS